MVFMKCLFSLSLVSLGFCVFGQSEIIKPKQTIPLNTLIHVKSVKKTRLKLGTSNIYSFTYFNGRRKIHAKFLVDEDTDSLMKTIADTLILLTRNYGFDLRMEDGKKLGFWGCRGWSGSIITDPIDTNKSIFLDYKEDSKSPVL